MAFPQKQVGKSLFLNVLIIVRNYNPLIDDDVNALSPAWVNSALRLRAMVVNSLVDYPRLDLAATAHALPTAVVTPDAKGIFTDLQGRFNIVKTDRSSSATLKSVKKYLPQTYRQSFNFIAPRDKNIGVTGDEYACAVKKNPDPDPNFIAGVTEDVSWGKVFAFCLRHKEIAKKCGFIHENLQIDLADGDFKRGGWLYIDLEPGSDYTAHGANFVKRYAARIPALDLTKSRGLLAPVLFPVLLNNLPPATGEPAQPSPALLDQMFREAAEYDDGFCKIVHQYQPVSSHALKETQDDEYPVVNDLGVRLGWDDEQVAAWHARQLGENPETPGVRADAPTGVFQYRVDARPKTVAPAPPLPWVTLNEAQYTKDVFLGGAQIGATGEQVEMGVEVYPAKFDAALNGDFWLPSYFSQWIGNSMVLQDEDAIAIFKKDQAAKNDLSPIPSQFPDGRPDPKVATKNTYYQAVGLDQVPLRYGKDYEFRVRMADMTSGGPTVGDNPIYDGVAPVAGCHFVRYVVPQSLNFVTPLPAKDTDLFTGAAVSVQRPRLGYPSVLFTGAYPDPVGSLIADADAIINSVDPVTKVQLIKRDPGLFDPDVDRVEVIVEIRALGMDTTIRKLDPKDNFALLYTTTRSFPGGFDGRLDIPLTFVDANELKFVGSQELPQLGIATSGKTNIDDRNDLVCPTARDVRITMKPLTQTRPDYYGGVDATGANRTFLIGMSSVFITRRGSTSEKNFFKPTGDVMQIRGLWMQPEEPIAVVANLPTMLVANLAPDDRIPTLLQRLAESVGADSKGASLIGRAGTRWQFGAARTIRHSAAPDNTSITFATKADLLNHWIVPVTLLVDRDWSWDGAEIVSAEMWRRKITLRAAMKAVGEPSRDAFLKDFAAKDVLTNEAVLLAAKEEHVGDLEWKRTINIQALVQSDRSQTYCCFLDGFDPKPADPADFPAEYYVSYRLKVHFKKENVDPPAADDDLTLYLHLPVANAPAQTPKIVAAGIAQSRYIRDKPYANTENRQKYLWIEFAEPPLDSNDVYYARMLAYGPDVLLARWEGDLLIAPQEPSLPIPPEPIRIISPGNSDDGAGLNAMQEMIPAKDSKVHFLVPAPPGLHPESLEMFGFFTYEFRVGHKIPWSTAAARFGRPIRNTGVQHPLPQLYAVAQRDQNDIWVSAPYAQTVFDGRNVTLNPPRTELWALLYAQVRMADDSDERNILLADRKLVILRDQVFGAVELKYNLKSDATPQGSAGWTNAEVDDMLALYGLPLDAPLSVLVVELFPGYDQFLVGERQYGAANAQNRTYSHPTAAAVPTFNAFKNYVANAHQAMEATRASVAAAAPADTQGPRPLTTDLGKRRILRTSLLTEVPAVCCVNC